MQTLPWDFALEIAGDVSSRPHEMTHHVSFQIDRRRAALS